MVLLVQGKDLVCMHEGCKKEVQETVGNGCICPDCNLDVQEYFKRARDNYKKSQKGPHPATAALAAADKFNKN